jgi:hypothetical protein
MGLSHYKRSRTGTGEETAKDVGGTREYGKILLIESEAFVELTLF